MSNKQLRNTIRFVHLVAGALVIALVYSDTLRTSAEFITLIRLFFIPVLVMSGIAMWQQAALSRLRRRASSGA
jgi:hypothetical protein